MQCLGLKATYDCQRLFFAARQDLLKIATDLRRNRFATLHSPLQPLARQELDQANDSHQAHHLMVGCPCLMTGAFTSYKETKRGHTEPWDTYTI